MVPIATFRRRALARKLAEKAPQRAAAAGTCAHTQIDLRALLARIWTIHKGSCWTTSDLRDAGLVRGDETRVVGQLLGAAAAHGAPVGAWLVQRGEADRSGRWWSLVPA